MLFVSVETPDCDPPACDPLSLFVSEVSAPDQDDVPVVPHLRSRIVLKLYFRKSLHNISFPAPSKLPPVPPSDIPDVDPSSLLSLAWLPSVFAPAVLVELEIPPPELPPILAAELSPVVIAIGW